MGGVSSFTFSRAKRDLGSKKQSYPMGRLTISKLDYDRISSMHPMVQAELKKSLVAIYEYVISEISL